MEYGLMTGFPASPRSGETDAVDIDQDLMEEAREEFARYEEYWREVRKAFAEDMKMCWGEQWREDVKEFRQSQNLPALTFPILHTFVQRASNQVRMNCPVINISPGDKDATKATAGFIEDWIRQMQYQSHASVIYEHAQECATAGSFGLIKLRTRYRQGSFDQEAFLEWELDPLSGLYVNPEVKDPSWRDAEGWFIRETISRGAYKRRFPGKNPVDFTGASDMQMQLWSGEDAVTIAEWWKVEKRPVKVVRLSDGDEGYAEDYDLEESVEEGDRTEDGDGPIVVEVREEHRRYVTMRLIDGEKELAPMAEWPGQWIPNIPVVGKQIVVNERRQLRSLIRPAHDAQRLLNTEQSEIARALGYKNMTPWIGPTGSFKSPGWNDPRTTRPFLEYEIVRLPDGTLAPPPTRAQSTMEIMDLVQASQMHTQAVSLAIGAETYVDDRRAEMSGKSVQQRTIQADLTNYHFQDALTHAIEFLGEQCLDLFPHLISRPTAVNARRENGEQYLAHIKVHDGDGGYEHVEGVAQEDHHNIHDGKYLAVAKAGPSFDTRRGETFERLIDFARAFPMLFQLAGDVIFENSDIPGADEIAKRMRNMVPPQALGQQAQVNPQQVQALAMQNQALSNKLRGLLMERQAKVIDNLGQIKKELIKARSGIIEQDMKHHHDMAMSRFDAEVEGMQGLMDLWNQQQQAASQIAGPDQTGQMLAQPQPSGHVQ